MPPLSLATSVMRCDEAASTDPLPPPPPCAALSPFCFLALGVGARAITHPLKIVASPLHDPKLFPSRGSFSLRKTLDALEGEVPLADHWGDGLRGVMVGWT